MFESESATAVVNLSQSNTCASFPNSGSYSAEENVLSMLRGEGKHKRFKARDIIYRENETIECAYVILGGMVKLLTYLPNGKARIVRLHSENHWLGIEGFVDQRFGHTAIAVSDTEVRQIPVSSLRRLERSDPGLYCRVMQQLYKHLVQADLWISGFSTGGIKPRVARLVDYLSDLEYGEASDIVELLTVHDMAEILGVTQESVSRVLAEFKRNDILHQQGLSPIERYRIDNRRLMEEARQ